VVVFVAIGDKRLWSICPAMLHIFVSSNNQKTCGGWVEGGYGHMCFSFEFSSNKLCVRGVRDTARGAHFMVSTRVFGGFEFAGMNKGHGFSVRITDR
jgi:hypothetical protein